MNSSEQFVEDHWPRIEKFSLPVEELIDEVRRHEALWGVIIDMTKNVNSREQERHAEIERLLRLLQTHSADPLTIGILIEKKPWLETQVRPNREVMRTIGRLIDIVGRTIAETYVLGLNEEDFPVIQQPEPSPDDESFLENIDGGSIEEFIRVTQKKVHETGYICPGHRLSEHGHEVASLICGKLDDILWPPVSDDDKDGGD